MQPDTPTQPAAPPSDRHAPAGSLPCVPGEAQGTRAGAGPKRAGAVQVRETAWDYARIVLGGLLMAMSINLFLAPNQVVAGGLIGLSIIANHVFAVPIGMALLAMNVPVLWLGWRYGGGFPFFVRTLAGLLALSLGTDLTRPFLPELSHDHLLVVFYGGVLSGAGLALVFRGRGTTGGIDIIGRLVNRRFGIPVGQTILAVNVAVYALAAVIFGIEPAMFALLLSFVAARTLDAVLYGLSATKSAFIISRSPDEVRAALLAYLGRGVTILDARGGYTGEPRQVLFVVVPRHEVMRLKRRVMDVDPDAFIAIHAAQEVLGGYPLQPRPD